MKTLVLNCGSSSIKYKLFDMTSGEVMAQGGIEKVGLPDSFLKFTDKNGEKVILEKAIPDHTVGIAFILDTLTDAKYGCLKNFKDIDAVGHRVVHGAEEFASSVLITKELLEKVKECTPLAPLHNPANLKGIEAIEKIMPGTPQVAVFDTAFHQTMPDYAYLYALPYRMYKDYGVRRYGFHGTSHRYVSRRACEILGVPDESHHQHLDGYDPDRGADDGHPQRRRRPGRTAFHHAQGEPRRRRTGRAAEQKERHGGLLGNLVRHA